MSEPSGQKMKFWECTRRGCHELFLDSRPPKPKHWVPPEELDDYVRCPKCNGFYVKKPIN